MFAAILKALGAFGAIFDYFKQKKITDAIEQKYEAQIKAEAVQVSADTAKEEVKREKEIEVLQEEVKAVKKTTNKSRKTRVIEG